MNAYEWCLESYLAHRRQRYWRIREMDRAVLGDGSSKNFDYLVRRPGAEALLLEVKGRRFPASGGSRWENWVTGGDLDALEDWEARFGDNAIGLIVFVYRITAEDPSPGRSWTPVTIDADRFGLVACPLREYRTLCRPRSRRWNTYSIPRADFTRIVRPLADWLPAGDGESREEVAGLPDASDAATYRSA